VDRITPAAVCASGRDVHARWKATPRIRCCRMSSLHGGWESTGTGGRCPEKKRGRAPGTLRSRSLAEVKGDVAGLTARPRGTALRPGRKYIPFSACGAEYPRERPQPPRLASMRVIAQGVHQRYSVMSIDPWSISSRRQRASCGGTGRGLFNGALDRAESAFERRARLVDDDLPEDRAFDAGQPFLL
jgi:hypothetical protein